MYVTYAIQCGKKVMEGYVYMQIILDSFLVGE